MKTFILIITLNIVLICCHTVYGQYGFGNGHSGNEYVNGSTYNTSNPFYTDWLNSQVVYIVNTTNTLSRFTLWNVTIPSGGLVLTGNTYPTNPYSNDGDLVIIIQMEDNTGSDALTNMQSTQGNYIIARVNRHIGISSIFSGAEEYELRVPTDDPSSNPINPSFVTSLTYSPFTQQGKVQLIVIPEYDNLTIYDNGYVTCHPYNHTTGLGGVICLAVKTTLEIENGSAIDATGKGYHEGTYYTSTSNSDDFGLGGDGGAAGQAYSITGNYTKGGYNFSPWNNPNGVDGAAVSTMEANPWNGEVYLFDDGSCPSTLLTNSNDPGDGGQEISGTNFHYGFDKTDFPIPDLHNSFNNATGPLFMGNNGFGGNGGNGGAGGGNGGGGAGAMNSTQGYDGTDGEDGISGAKGGDGAVGGGVIIIRANTITAPYVSTGDICIRSDGQNGNAGESAGDPNYPNAGRSGDGGKGGDGYISGTDVYLPGRGGAPGATTPALGGKGGHGGNGGSIMIVYYQNNALTDDNLSVVFGNMGDEGDDDHLRLGDREDGDYEDISTQSTDCHYELFKTDTIHCSYDYIFENFFIGSTNWLTTAYQDQYTWEVNGWECSYNIEDEACYNSFRISCSKSITTGQGYTEPRIKLKTIYDFDLQELNANDANDLWADLYDEMYNNNPSLSFSNGILTITGSNYVFHYSSPYGILDQYDGSSLVRSIQTCCYSETEGDPDEDGDNGDKLITTEDIITPELRKSDTTAYIVQNMNFGLYPNPASNSVDILCSALKDRYITFIMKDALGRILSVKEILVPENDYFCSFDIEKLSKGTYIMTITDKQTGIQLKTIKFNKI